MKELLVILRCPKCRAYLGRRNFVAALSQKEELKCQRCREWIEPIETKD